MHIKLDLKVFLFIIIFFIMNKIKIYVLLMAFGLIHEIGHLICGIALGLKPDSVKILPYGFKLIFKTNYMDYNKKVKKGTILSIKRIIIYLAGPLCNLIIALIAGLMSFKQDFSKIEVIYCNLLIAFFNLAPIYPMDGGKIIHEILHVFIGLKKSYQLTKDITWISLSILTALTGIVVLYYNSFSILAVLFYIWTIALKTQKEIEIKQRILESIETNKLKFV